MEFVDPTLRSQSSGETPLRAYVPPPPRIGRAPQWLTKRIRKHMPELKGHWGWDTGISLVYEAAYSCGDTWGRWIDHSGTLKLPDGRQAFVSEPYPLGLDALQALLAFCDRLDITCSVHAASSHYPTACLRLILTEKD
jgi:hypothetical protein|tara:strand:- start:202 stop:615 length:414 start_codon:yes stop_codon:yes gene_type:complete